MVMGVPCPNPCPTGKLRTRLSSPNLTLGAEMDPGVLFCQGKRSENWTWPAKILAWNKQDLAEEFRPESMRLSTVREVALDFI